MKAVTVKPFLWDTSIQGTPPIEFEKNNGNSLSSNKKGCNTVQGQVVQLHS